MDDRPADRSPRPVARAEIASCLALSREAGWNQVAEDWSIFLDHGTVHGIDAPDGRLAATAATLPLGPRLAWISMVLVATDSRRRGLATRLVRRCIDAIEATGRIAGLDATPDGRPVYARLGFEDAFRLTRLQRPGLPSRAAPPGPPASRADVDRGLRTATAADLPAIARLDRAALGAERPAILARLLGRRPDLGVIAIEDGRPVGFALGREGRVATQLGPVVAEDAAAADRLVEALLARIGPEACFIDLADGQDRLRRRLERAGFTAQRPFTRMVRGPAPALDPQRLVAAAGPELA